VRRMHIMPTGPIGAAREKPIIAPLKKTVASIQFVGPVVPGEDE